MEATKTCNYCKKEVRENEVFCPNCNYPLQGSDKEKSVFIGQQVLKKGTINDARSFRKSSRILLIYLGCINLLSPLLYFISEGDFFFIDFLLHLLIGSVFLVLARKAKEPVLYPFIVGLGLLVLIYIFNGIIDPSSIAKGMIWKGVNISLLIIGFVLTYMEREIKREHKNLQ